ncbi:hypothetical protein HYPSUDRAFT_63412 [Hypholoma sublateritium FD-334 SS-4]|uniref:Uncharacterized protein n=1 Tax=Hypholoma sublateritium (strain FD-334 SS-4) TaxID=945553 RepID=A0A0D2LHR2_HYPSF|nr:hypothetical protein HYPSUDRAFT_63412 [Hypholoma sublateritium FD-334 SS-4]
MIPSGVPSDVSGPAQTRPHALHEETMHGSLGPPPPRQLRLHLQTGMPYSPPPIWRASRPFSAGPLHALREVPSAPLGNTLGPAPLHAGGAYIHSRAAHALSVCAARECGGHHAYLWAQIWRGPAVQPPAKGALRSKKGVIKMHACRYVYVHGRCGYGACALAYVLLQHLHGGAV